MKVQEVIMRAMAKKITWRQAGEANDRRGDSRGANRNFAKPGNKMPGLCVSSIAFP
jgi:hypothetical protein